MEVNPVILIYDLNKTVSEKMLYEKFGKYFKLESVLICRNKITRESSGFGIVIFEEIFDAHIAYRAFRDQEWYERTMIIGRPKIIYPSSYNKDFMFVKYLKFETGELFLDQSEEQVVALLNATIKRAIESRKSMESASTSQPTTEQQNLPCQPATEQQTLPPQPTTEQQTLPSQPTTEQQNLTSQLTTTQQNVQSQPTTEQQTVPSQPSTEQQALPSQPFSMQQNISSQPLSMQQAQTSRSTPVMQCVASQNTSVSQTIYRPLYSQRRRSN